MANNPYAVKLQRDLDAVRQRRRAIKDTLDRMARGQWISGNGEEQVVIRRNLEGTLRVTEQEWQRLHHELGIPLPYSGPPIKLPPAEVSLAEAARYRARATASRARQAARPAVTRSVDVELRRRGFDGNGYLTKDMKAGR